jgi:uncharacterized protein (UPF0335 family)
MARKARDLNPDASAKPAKPQLTPEQRAEVLDRNVKIALALDLELAEAMVGVQAIRGRISAANKVARKDGCDVRAIKRAIELKKRSADEVIAEHKATVEILKIMESPLGTQFDFFKDVEVKDVVTAEAAGYAAGKNNENFSNNPYQAGTEDHAKWSEGWHRNQRELAQQMAPKGNGAAKRGNGKRQHPATIPPIEETAPKPGSTSRGGSIGAASG